MLINLIKGIIIGIGGIAPGLSGSVLMVIFGLYEDVLESISTMFKDYKSNILYLLPIFIGIGLGMILFSNIINYLLKTYEMYTRFFFLGLIIGTIPLFRKEVIKNGWNNKYYLPMLISFLLGTTLFFFNDNLFPTLINTNLLINTLMGFTVAGSMIIPGIDSAVILSSLGMYELYVSSIANLNMGVLIPVGIGLGVGTIIISTIMNKLIKKHYTVCYSIIFGLFISIIPSILNENSILGFNKESYISITLVLIGIIISYLMGEIKKT